MRRVGQFEQPQNGERLDDIAQGTGFEDQDFQSGTLAARSHSSLFSVSQPFREALGQAGGANLRLRRGNIVVEAPQFD